MKGRSFFFGYTVFTVAKENIEKVINLCNAQNISFGDIQLKEDDARFCISLMHEPKFKREAKKRKIEAKILSRRGLPSLLIRYKRRAGLLIGAILCAITLTYASGLIWDIRVEGADGVNQEKIISDLRSCGFEIGSKKKGIDTSVLENKMLIVCDEISWISVNIKGTVASVVVRKAEYPPKEEEKPICSNVVASQSGRIVGFEDVKGDVCTKIGDEVSKGQILISGISGEEGEPLRLMASEGRVLAEVEEEIKIEIPKKYQKKITKSSEKEEKYLIFFKNTIKIFSNSRNYDATCDKIDIIENLYTNNGKKLPIATKTVKYVEYEYVECERTNAQMEELATQKLFSYINEELSDAEILTRSTRRELCEDKYILTCNIKCIKNIAQIREVEITP